MGWPQTQTVFDLGIESMVHINIHVWMRCVYVFPMQLEPNGKQNKQRTEKNCVRTRKTQTENSNKKMT